MRVRLFGVLLLIETVALLLAALVSLYYGENDLNAFLISAGITGLVGLVLYLIGLTRRTVLDSDDAFVVVGLSWVIISLFGMLPFLLSGSIDNVTDALFETISGFSTTGSTILRNVDEQFHGILFWRSIMQWLGGLGIMVFTLAFIPSVAKGSRKTALFAAEAPGVSVEKLSPSMHGTARILWIIYILLTLLCTLFYAMGPMSFFDAVCHAMTTISTGGYSTHQDSIGYFQSSYVEYVSIVFMISSSINFAMFYFLVLGRFDLLRKNEEVRVYLISIVVMTLVYMGLFHFAPSINGVTEAQLASYPEGGRETFEVSFFHVVSMLSNTGFSGRNCNYDLWGILFVIPTLLMHEAVLRELLAQDGIALAERLQAVARDGAGAADAQAGAGERLAIDHIVGQAEFLAHDADFVLEQQLDGLHKFERQVLGQAAHVVVGLDGAGFDDVRVDGPLGQEADTVQLAGLFLEHADEFRADDLALLLGIGHAGELVQEAVDGIDIDQVGLELVAEHAHHLLGLALAEESVVDMDGDQLIAHGLDEERRDHR